MERSRRTRSTISSRFGTGDWLSGAGSGTYDGNPLLGLGSSMKVISSTSRISIIGVTLITAAVLPEPICIATQTWTMPMNEKFRYVTIPDV